MRDQLAVVAEARALSAQARLLVVLVGSVPDRLPRVVGMIAAAGPVAAATGAPAVRLEPARHIYPGPAN